MQTAPNAGFGSARRGIYAGATFEHTPSCFNTFSTYHEARLYGFGLIPGRPNDLISFVANHNQFSGGAVSAARGRGLLADDGVSTYTASYGALALPGLNVNVGVSYTDHPTMVAYTRSTGSALNILLNNVIFLSTARRAPARPARRTQAAATPSSRSAKVRREQGGCRQRNQRA